MTHRELRNNSGELFRALADGEEILLTNRGKAAGRIISVDEKLPELPVSRPRRINDGRFTDLKRLPPRRPTQKTLDYLREERV